MGDGKKTFLSSKNVSFRTIRLGYEKNWNCYDTAKHFFVWARLLYSKLNIYSV